MATEGAGGLSTLAIEVAIHALEARDEPDRLWVEARAELAALTAAAGQIGPLRAALSGLLGGIDVYDRPDPGQSMCRGLHTLRAVDEAIALVVADAGPGAAGARAESALLTAALGWRRARAALSVAARDDAAARDRLGLLRERVELRARDLEAAVDALDAPRAGGAGDKEAGDG